MNHLHIYIIVLVYVSWDNLSAFLITEVAIHPINQSL